MFFVTLLAFASCQASKPTGDTHSASRTTAPSMTGNKPNPSAKSSAPPSVVASAATPSAGSWWVPGNEFEPLESVAATRSAKAAGLKQTLMVPHPVKCPSIPSAGVEPKGLRASGVFAPLLADPKAFFDASIGVLEALALLGPAVLCNHQPKSAFMDLHLAPIAGAQGVTIETQDGQLIGIVIEYEPPAKIDFAALSAAFGTARQMPRSPHGPYPGSDTFDLKSATHEGTISIGRIDHEDPPNATRVHRMILRRFGLPKP